MRKISPGNCIMGQNTPQEMGLDMLGNCMHHQGVNPGADGPKMSVFGLKLAQMRVCHK